MSFKWKLVRLPWVNWHSMRTIMIHSKTCYRSLFRRSIWDLSCLSWASQWMPLAIHSYHRGFIRVRSSILTPSLYTKACWMSLSRQRLSLSSFPSLAPRSHAPTLQHMMISRVTLAKRSLMRSTSKRIILFWAASLAFYSRLRAASILLASSRLTICLGRSRGMWRISPCSKPSIKTTCTRPRPREDRARESKTSMTTYRIGS